MDNIQDICVEEGVTVGESIMKLDSAGKKVLLVTKEHRLTGIITDGDVRRWILKKGAFDADVSKMMHKDPRVVKKGEHEKAKNIMIDMQLVAVPIVDENNIPIDIIFWHDIVGEPERKYNEIEVPVVIMAGGKGTRLYPYTDILPKPLIPIGQTTILERIIDSFYKNGCKEFWLTLNYKKNLIKAYLDDKDKEYKVNYVEEESFLGTCGSIKLLENKIAGSFFVSNCDVLIDVDYAELLNYHQKNENELTVVTSLKHMQMPYGVIELNEGGAIHRIIEKPSYSCNINTGIYVMEASIIKYIPENQVFHMTDLMNRLLNENRKIGAYPITEQRWQDMGEIGEMRKMISSFQDNL